MVKYILLYHRLIFVIKFSQNLSVIIYLGREVVGELNTTDKSFILQIMATVQLPGEKGYVTHMVIHSVTSIIDVSLA